MGGSVARAVHALGVDRRARRDRSRQSHRPELSELAGAGSCHPGQYHPGLPGDQQELQPLVFGKRSVEPGVTFSVAAKDTKSRKTRKRELALANVETRRHGDTETHGRHMNASSQSPRSIAHGTP